ncbi:MAG: hypothetical protein ACTSR3_12465 [Candidatus Helarchaeota archaeon]
MKNEEKQSKIKQIVKGINEILNQILNFSNKSNLNDFSKLVANYNKELNSILSNYHGNKDLQDLLKPYVMFYRQLFQELMFITSQDSFPEENMEHIQRIILQKEDLINTHYKVEAEKEIENINIVSNELEKCLKKRLEMQKMLRKQKKLDHYS